MRKMEIDVLGTKYDITFKEQNEDELLEDSDGYTDKTTNVFKEWTEDEKEFVFEKETGKPIKRNLSDFRVGLKVPGKLRPKRIRGGILLIDTPYEMR